MPSDSALLLFRFVQNCWEGAYQPGLHPPGMISIGLPNFSMNMVKVTMITVIRFAKNHIDNAAKHYLCDNNLFF